RLEIDATKKLSSGHAAWIGRIDELIFPKHDFDNLLAGVVDLRLKGKGPKCFWPWFLRCSNTLLQGDAAGVNRILVWITLAGGVIDAGAARIGLIVRGHGARRQGLFRNWRVHRLMCFSPFETKHRNRAAVRR